MGYKTANGQSGLNRAAVEPTKAKAASSGRDVLLLHDGVLRRGLSDERLDLQRAFPALAAGIQAFPQRAQIARPVPNDGFPNLALSDVPTDADVHKHRTLKRLGTSLG
jgi:hypothetical protein